LPGKTSHCDRREEPRDVVDPFILAWERDELTQLESSLGPDGRAALETLLKERAWKALRAELWRGRYGYDIAVGYRFGVASPWALPEETLDTKNAASEERLGSFELDTQFTDSAGRDCGRQP
jgi:hypothetical protein